MQLLTNEIRKTLPPLYAQDGDPKAMVMSNSLTPWGQPPGMHRNSMARINSLDSWTWVWDRGARS